MRDRLMRWSHSRWRDPILFAIAVGVGIAYFVAVLGAKPGAAGDTATYVELSAGILTGGGFQLNGQPSATYPPGYPIFLAPFIAVFGGTGIPVVAVQWMLGGFASVLVARIGDVIYDRIIGLIAGAGAATAPQLALWEAYAVSDVLGLTLTLAGILFLFRAMPPGDASRRSSRQVVGSALLSGALFGLAALVRPLSLTLTLPALAWIAMRHSETSMRRRVAVATFVLAGLAVTLAPWSIRNAVEFGGFFPLSTRNGWQLIQATEWELHGRGTVGIDVTYPEAAAGLPEGDADRLLTEMAFDRIRSDPLDFAKRAGMKSLFFWLPTAPGLGPASLLMGIEFCGVALLAAPAVFVRSARRGLIFWIVSTGATAGVALTILDPDYRYRLPVLMVLLPPAAWSVAQILRVQYEAGSDELAEFEPSRD